MLEYVIGRDIGVRPDFLSFNDYETFWDILELYFSYSGRPNLTPDETQPFVLSGKELIYDRAAPWKTKDDLEEGPLAILLRDLQDRLLPHTGKEKDNERISRQDGGLVHLKKELPRGHMDQYRLGFRLLILDQWLAKKSFIELIRAITGVQHESIKEILTSQELTAYYGPTFYAELAQVAQILSGWFKGYTLRNPNQKIYFVVFPENTFESLDTFLAHEGWWLVLIPALTWFESLHCVTIFPIVGAKGKVKPPFELLVHSSGRIKRSQWSLFHRDNHLLNQWREHVTRAIARQPLRFSVLLYYRFCSLVLDNYQVPSFDFSTAQVWRTALLEAIKK